MDWLAQRVSSKKWKNDLWKWKMEAFNVGIYHSNIKGLCVSIWVHIMWDIVISGRFNCDYFAKSCFSSTVLLSNLYWIGCYWFVDSISYTDQFDDFLFDDFQCSIAIIFNATKCWQKLRCFSSIRYRLRF